jgi:thioredoxin 1
MVPIIEEVANEYKDKLKVTKLNIEEAGGIASQYGIMSVPTLFIFKKGKIVEQTIGVVPKQALKKKIEAILS